MKIQVLADDGTTAFEYDTAKGSNCLCPGLAEKPAVVAALTEASTFLGSEHHTVSSIIADFQAASARIEHELGSHPAFSWAQTKLGQGIAHLEAYLSKTWEQTFDNRVAAPPVDTDEKRW